MSAELRYLVRTHVAGEADGDVFALRVERREAQQRRGIGVVFAIVVKAPAREQAIRAVELIVKAQRELVKVNGLRRIVGEGAGVGVRQRNVFVKVQGLGRKPVLGNDVARKLGARGSGATGCGERVIDLAEVAGTEVSVALSRARHHAVLHDALPQTLPLVAAEEEGTILAAVDMGNGERSAERAAELVALERLSVDGEEIAGIQLVIAQEFEQVAVELIAAGLGG